MDVDIDEQELCREAALYDSDDDDVLCRIAAQYDESPVIQRSMHTNHSLN